MAQAIPKDVIDEIRSTLDSNITDPNPDRSSDQNWIYTIPINYDIAMYPRIHIHDVSSTHQGLSVGSTERWMENRIQISVFMGVGSGNKMDVDDDGELENPNKVLDSIVNDVITQINDNQSIWRGLGTENNVYSVLTQEEQRRQDDKNSVIQHDIDALIKMSR